MGGRVLAPSAERSIFYDGYRGAAPLADDHARWVRYEAISGDTH